MTKKDYEMIAQLINGTTVYHNEKFISKEQFIENLCKRLKEDNPKFSPTRFKVAAGLMTDEDVNNALVATIKH